MSEERIFRDLVHAYLTHRSNQVLSGSGRPPVAGAETLGANLMAEEARGSAALLQERDRLGSLWFRGHRDAKTEVTISSVQTLDPDRRRVEVVEQSELFFVQPVNTTDPASGLTPASSESYRLSHTFDLQRSDDRWIIVAATPHLGFGPPPPTQVDKPVIGLRDRSLPDDVTAGLSTTPPAATSEKTTTVDFNPRSSAAAGFNWQAVIDWAYTYVFDYSPSFREYPNDCTNFLSQAMIAGGWEPTGHWWNRTDPDVWFYGSATWSTSYSWAAAHNFNIYAYNHSGRTQHLDNVFLLQPADILQVDWDHPSEGDVPSNIDHSFIVTGRVPNDADPTAPIAKDILLTYHTNDRKDVPLSSILARPDAQPEDRWFALHTF